MLVWSDDSETGGRYDPVADTWSPISTVNAPPFIRTAVWTGSEMLVWNGTEGRRYRPSTDTWTTMSGSGAPPGKVFYTEVWTGSELIVWGGSPSVFPVAEGARYRPDTDTWTPTSLTGAPQARFDHTAVWTGSEMIVWGGVFRESGSGDIQLSSGGRYDPATNTWTPTSMTAPPAPRHSHTAVWTGSVMIVWGGSDSGIDLTNLNSGGRYDASADSWAPTTLIEAPDGRHGHQALWTDVGMIVLGQNGEGGIYSFGQSLDLDGDGYSHCTGDCNDLSAVVHPGADEVCDGIDNDCDGLSDEGFAPPQAVGGLAIGPDEVVTEISWPPVDGASGYDAVEGDLGLLAATGGDFTAATLMCEFQTSGATTGSWTSVVGPRQGLWLLVRARGCLGAPGTYDEASASQQGSRDAEIEAAPGACP
jgi:hypothetical protein